MRTVVTCMGEALIDFVPLNTLVEGERTTSTMGDAPRQARRELAKDFRLYPGGSIFNVAIGIARLGQHASFAGKIADDFFGHHLLSALQAEGVDTRFIATANAKSTLAFAALKEGEAAYSFYGEGTADAQLTADDIPVSLYAKTNILHFGSVSLLRGTTPATVLATVERLKGRALLSCDPNIRASLIHDEPVYRALLQRLIALTDILKLSDIDLAWLLPGVPVEEALLHLSEQGPALVIITRGEQGILAGRSALEAIQVPSFRVPIVDTVGAGDVFCAGILAQLAEKAITSREALVDLSEQELRAMLRFASAVAAVNCTRACANPPSLSEVKQFLLGAPGAFA